MLACVALQGASPTTDGSLRPGQRIPAYSGLDVSLPYIQHTQLVAYDCAPVLALPSIKCKFMSLIGDH